MNLIGKYRIILLCFLMALIGSATGRAQEDSGFDPVNMELCQNEAQLMMVRIIVNKERAFLVESHWLAERPALPVMAVLRELQIKYKTNNEGLVLNVPGTTKEVTLNMRGNGLKVEGQMIPVHGEMGDSDYFLSLHDWVYIIGTEPVWSSEHQDVLLTVALSRTETGLETDSEGTPASATARPFQPINRLDLYFYGRGDGWGHHAAPGFNNSSIGLDWQTYGILWGGQLTLGGTLDWVIKPDSDWDSPFTTYRWETDTAWGHLTVGTQDLEFWGTLPIDWEMRGISLTDLKRDIRNDWATDVVGTTKTGNKAELWINDRLVETTLIKDGRYCFEEVWIPQKMPVSVVIVIKEGDTAVERRNVNYISGESLMTRSEKQYIFAIGESKTDDGYTGWAGAGEWVHGITDDLTLGGHYVATDDNNSQNQAGLNLAWRPEKNLVLKAEAWAESSENAWRISSDWGYRQVYLQGRLFHRDAGFVPIFPSEERDTEMDLAQLALHWYPKPGWEGILSGEYVRETQATEVDYLRWEAGLDFKKGNWHGTGSLEWQNEDPVLGETITQERIFLALFWDFNPNQWIECGIDRDKTGYESAFDKYSNDHWIRWTNHSKPRDRWWIEAGYLDTDIEDEQRLESKWNHRWTDEWGTYTGLGFGWGEDISDYQRWTWSCGLEYRMDRGLSLSIGYDYSAYQRDNAADEYRQNIWFQVSTGINFGSGKPTLIPFGGNSQTTGVVSGIVYRDLNGNGIRDKNECGVNGIKVQMDEVSTVLTDAEGRYVFYNVAAGIHRIGIDQFTLPLNFNASERHRMIHVVAGASLKEDLGLLVVGAVSGRVFIDANSNGAFDQGETVLAGVRVHTERGDVWATTGKDGDYYIQLMAGEHKLVIDPSTLPSDVKAGAGQIVKLGEDGEEVTGMDLGVQ